MAQEIESTEQRISPPHSGISIAVVCVAPALLLIDTEIPERDTTEVEFTLRL